MKISLEYELKRGLPVGRHKFSSKYLILVGVNFICIALTSHALAAEKAAQSATGKIYESLFSGQRKSDAQQKRSRSNTSVMGVRGLGSDSEAQEKSLSNANMRAVYEMEDRTPDADLIDRIKGQLKKQGVATDSNPANNTIDVDSFTTEELRGEIELGRKMAAQILGFNEPISNEKIQGYVNALTGALAQLGLKTERPFRVSVLNSEQINAFACPGGYIFITQGALRATQSEAQLAAILGHEIVHVSKRHLLSSLKNKVAKKSPQKTQENVHQKNRLRIKPDDKAKSAQWAQILGPKGVGLTLLQASSEAIETLLSKGLEQEFELEADALGSQITSASGYNANRFVELLAKMQSRKEASADRTSTTHPAYSLRIEKLIGLASSSSTKQSTGLDSTSLYSEMQKEWQNP